MPEKQKSFNSDGATQATNQLGLKNERIRMYFGKSPLARMAVPI